jgi:hypothetical protein
MGEMKTIEIFAVIGGSENLVEFFREKSLHLPRLKEDDCSVLRMHIYSKRFRWI